MTIRPNDPGAGAPGPLVLFSTNGGFSAAVLRELAGAGLTPAAVVLPGPEADLLVQQVAAAGSTAALAQDLGIPVLHLAPGNAAAVADRLATLAPVLGVMACFPRRLPAALAGLPAWGTLNLHPSPLPRYRGPAPLFWQLKDGARTLWVSLHRVEAEMDAGAVVLRRCCPLPPGADGAALDGRLAALGVAGLAGLLAGHPGGDFPAELQDAAEATYQSWPRPTDFAVDPRRGARRAYAFMVGTAHWGLSYGVTGAGPGLRLARAVSYAPRGRLPAPVVEHRGCIRLQCSPGILRARLARRAVGQ